ncbi:MAG: GDSL-type esterase/lipase family protein, partial [Planctomycetota bacterium]
GGKGVLRLRGLVVYRGDDRSAPAPPAGLEAEVSADGVALSWEAASDNTAAAGYAVSRAGDDGRFVKVGQPCLPRFVDRPGEPGRYRYRVLAWDFQENLSPWSEPMTVKVGRRFEPGEPTREEKDRASYAGHVREVHAAGAGKVVRGRVLCYGDSLTGATNYRHYAAAALGRYEVIAKGYPAMRTSFGAKHIDRHMKEHRPEFCLILYGTNNSKAEKRIPPAMDHLLAIARSCETHGTVPIIGTIPPRGFRDPTSKPEARFNEALIKMCRTHKIPIAYIFEEYQTCGTPRRKLLAGDGVHTVSGGWVCMGKAWRAAMEQVRFVLLDRPAAK